MNQKTLFLFLIVMGCHLVLHPLAWALSSPNVLVDDEVYQDLEKLEAFGFVRTAIHGQRPWSRTEVARLIEEAQKNWVEQCGDESRENENSKNCRRLAPKILKGLKIDYREELALRGEADGKKKKVRYRIIEQANFEYTLLDSPRRDIPVKNGVGQIDGFVNPLVQFREGLDFADGNTLGFESRSWISPSRYFSFYFRPNFRILVPNTQDAEAQFIVQDLYGKFKIMNIELEVGRDHLIWGQSREGGLLLSTNARALDMIKLSNDTPFYFPWVFKHLGASKIGFFVSNLGPERVFKDSFLYGLKWSLKPARFVELGFSETIIIGGDGAPELSFFDPLAELFPFHKIGHNNEFEDQSDHRFGIFDARFLIPPLRNTAVYYESFFDDSPWRAFGNFSDIWDEMAVLTGIRVPMLTGEGNHDLTLEYRHLPGWAYRHSKWTTGYTLNRELIGDPLGPDADSVRLVAGIDIDPRHFLEVELAYENRDSDLFRQTKNSDGGNEQVVRRQDNPTEHRYRMIASWQWHVTPRLCLKPQFGYEHVGNFDFQQNSDRENFLGSVEIIMKVSKPTDLTSNFQTSSD